MTLGTARVIRGNALALPLEDESVDLIVTSPPYFGLRSYQDGGQAYDGQIGTEPTPTEFVDALIAATREMVRVLKPSGSIWVNLGDRYQGSSGGGPPSSSSTLMGNGHLGGGPKQKAGAGRPESRSKRPRRATGAQFTREDAAWLAGVIDSDGSISVHVNKQPEGNAPSFVPWVRVGQMRPEVVERIAEVVGTGKVFHDERGVWNWAASAQQARWVLERIHPWLLIKKRQAWAAIEVARHVEERNAKGSWRPLTPDDVAYRQRLRDAVLTWNKGGQDDLTAPEPPPVSLPLYPLAARDKSLLDVPHMYAQECIGRLGLILRAEIIWSKPNGLPESVTDRARRSHETWFHFTKSPRYYSAVDEIREPSVTGDRVMFQSTRGKSRGMPPRGPSDLDSRLLANNPLGKLPGSVWEIPTQPLTVPDHLGIDHYAAFPLEWPRRIIAGWSPPGICTACGQGRRPVVTRESPGDFGPRDLERKRQRKGDGPSGNGLNVQPTHLTGYACACPDTTAPTTPSVILDPFGGTGTTALAAKAAGRTGITIDMSADYCRLAEWRCNDPGQLAAAMQVDKPAPVAPDQLDLLEGLLA
jgi:DNA modification methylase